VRQLVDASGVVVLARGYDPYGNVSISVGAAQSAYGFAGEQQDSQGLIYLRARYYDPGAGRFITSDPSQLEANLYQYAQSNPVRYVDPSGYIAENEETYADSVVADLHRFGVSVDVDWGHSPRIKQGGKLQKGYCRVWYKGNWSVEDLTELKNAVHIVSDGVDNLGGNFQSLLGPIVVRREDGSESLSDPSVIHYKVDGDDSVYKRYAIIHELGHEVMYHNMRTLLYFMNQLGSQCNGGIIADNYPYCLNSGKRHTGKYEPGDSSHLPSDYAGRGNFEDYAETFREVVVKAYLDMGTGSVYYNYAQEEYTYNKKDNHDIGSRRTIMKAIINGTWNKGPTQREVSGQ
jgi:RHS repeat-associated protein